MTICVSGEWEMEASEGTELASLVEKGRAGDSDALDELVRRYQRRVAAFVFAMTGEPATVDDLAQDIFVKMFQKIATLRNAENFEAWLFRLARNTCRDHFRKEKWRILFVPFRSHHEEVAEAAEIPEDVERLLHALQQLPPAQRELLALLKDGDWSYEELARMTNSTVSAVRSRLFRARAELKQIYG